MGFYNTHFMPRLVDCACGMKAISKQRQKVVPLATGHVVEVGIGSGLNLPHYAADRVTKLTGIDPDENMWKRSEKRRQGLAFPVERIGLSGEEIPLPDDTADTVVTTYSLCTIPDPVAALRELRRIVKPGGKLLFAEHGQAPDQATRKWQERIDPYWKKIAGGCHSGRPIPDYLDQAGWASPNIQHNYIPGPKVLAYNYWGTAKPA